MKKINIDDYQPLIFKIVNRFPIKYKDELLSELYIQLDDLLKRFDSTKGKFETYSYQRLYYACIDFITANTIEHDSLDEFISIDGEEIRKIDSILSELDIESDYIKKDYLVQKNKTLTDIELFIRKKYFNDGLSVKQIIRIFSPYHHIKGEKTIRKILIK